MIIECKEPSQIMLTFSVMRQLRPHLEESKYLQLITSLMETEKYRLIAFLTEGRCVAVAGFRLQQSLFTNGELVLYVDDLVTDQMTRSQGFGKTLFEWLKKECKRLGCKGIVLDSGTQRAEAHKFYYREGMKSTAFHFYRAASPVLPETEHRVLTQENNI